MAARIIVADDSSTIQKVVELSLAREDVELIQARSGEEAMRKAQDGKPDLMLIDHSMPDRSGSELCGELRKNAQLKDIPIILMAGGKQPFDEAAARRVGANGVVTKPFDSGTLIGKVKQMLTGAPAPPVPEAAPAPAPQEDMVSVEQSPVAVEPLAPSSEEMEPPLSQDLMEEMMAQQPLPTDPSFDLTEPAAAPQAESVPTYDLPSTDVETPSLEKAMEEAAKATPTAKMQGLGALKETAPPPKPAEGRTADTGVAAGPLNVSPDLIDRLAGEVARHVATHIVQELKSDLLDRVERILWEVVPELGEQLITQEIERIRQLVEGKKK